MNRCGNRQNGVVLVSVLWVVAGLSVLVASSLTSVRTDLQLTRTHLRLAQARALSEAGVYYAIYSLLQPREAVRPGLPDAPVELMWDGVRVSLVIENEAGKIDVNTARIRLIENALIRSGVDASAARRAVSDLDRKRRQPASSVPEESAADGMRYDTAAEFVSGLDVPVAVMRRLLDSFTVHNKREGVNPLAAGREVLLAVPGMSEGRVDSYLEQRGREPFRTPDPGYEDRYFSDRLSAVYSITARAAVDGAVSTVGSKVRLSSLRETPYEILEWRSTVDFIRG